MSAWRSSRSLRSEAAGTVDLERAYERCRLIHRARGRSYYRATTLLAADQRPHVHALYAFTRLADDIVDDGLPTAEASRRLAEWRTALLAALAGEPTENPVLPAVAHTVRTLDIAFSDIDLFLRSMAMDLTVTRYRAYADLLGYMEGSSAVIGTLMLPVLGVVPGSDLTMVGRCAQELGYGFQLTNFVRDVAEDLGRGRVYLPQEDLDRFGVTVDTLSADAARGCAGPAVRELVRFECGRAWAHYRAALTGIAALQPRSRVCIRAAFVLYGGILAEVARSGFDVMAGRASVPTARRARLVAVALHGSSFSAQVARLDRALDHL